MGNDSGIPSGVTRRQFIKIAPIGIAGALALTIISKRVMGSLFNRRKASTQLPEDSIFTPANGKYTQT